MNCETLVSTACRLLRFRSIHSIHGGRFCSNRLASLGVNPSKVKQGMKTWSSGGKPVGGIVLFSWTAWILVPFLRLFSLDETMKCNDVHNWRKWWLIVNLRSNPSRNLKRLGGRKGWDSATIGLGIWEGSAGNVKLRTKKNKSIKVSNYSHRIS